MSPGKDTPVHWGLNSRNAVGGPCGSDSRYTANMVAERGLLRAGGQRDGTLGCRGVEQGTTGDVQRQAAQSGLGRRAARHVEETDDECVGLLLKQGVFPKHDHHQQLV